MTLTGWDAVDATFLADHATGLDAIDAARFRHGAQPDWRHALASEEHVPRRPVVARAGDVLLQATSPTTVLFVGPGGTGKSTALRQVAVDLARAGRRVLFRRPGEPFTGGLPGGVGDGDPWILASDDADEIVADIVRAAQAAGPRPDVHWLLAARDTDWDRQFPRGEPWDRLGLTEWPARPDRAEPWKEAPAFAPADPAGLEPPLRQAFLYAAAAEVLGIDGVDLRVLADLTGVARGERRTIRTDLGRLGLATGSGEALRLRHPSLAGAALTLMPELFPELVRATATAAKDTRPLVSDGAIVTGAPTVAARLIEAGVPSEQAHDTACAAADAAADVLDNLLMTALFRSRTYRTAGHTAEADAILAAAVADANATDDWAETARGFITELSLHASTPEAAVVLAGVALADLPGLGPVTMVDARAPLVRIGHLAEPTGDLRLLAAVAWLGRRVTPNFDPVKSEFRRYGDLAAEGGIECTPNEAVQWLGEAVAAAFEAATGHDDDLVNELLAVALPDGGLAFQQLLRTAARGQEPR